MGELHQALQHLTTDLRAAAVPERVPQMVAYMKDNFDFLGLTSPERKALQKPLLAVSKHCEIDEILDVADLCWEEDAREFQYVASDLLRARAKLLRPHDLDRLHHFVTTKSWWDTVDALAAHPTGTLISRFPALGEEMDIWIDDPNIWVARTAILHQLRYKTDVDEARLFAYALKRAADTEFFIRKALGWALRSYARVAPDQVRTFVDLHEGILSGLTKREARKHL